MKQLCAVHFSIVDVRAGQFAIEIQDGLYVFIRREGDLVTHRLTFETKRELRDFLKTWPGSINTEESNAAVLLYAQLLAASEDPRDDLRQINKLFPDGVISIGTVAIYLHTRHSLREKHATSTRHVGCYIGKDEFARLCDLESVVFVPALHKRQFQRETLMVDLYLDGEHRLAIPYEQIERNSSIIDGIRVAGKEHLLILAIDEAINHFDLPDGRESRKDIYTLLMDSESFNFEFLAGELDDVRLSLLHSISEDIAMFQDLFECDVEIAKYCAGYLKQKIAILESA